MQEEQRLKRGAKLYLLDLNQKVVGPFRWTLLREWFALEFLTGTTLVCIDGENEWRPLSDFAEIINPSPNTISAVSGWKSEERALKPSAPAQRLYLDHLGCPFRFEGLDLELSWRVIGQLLDAMPDRADQAIAERALEECKKIRRQRDLRKQRAYLSFMGVRDSEALTEERVDAELEKVNRLRVCPLDEKLGQRLQSLDKRWSTERFLLHPELFSQEFDYFLSSELPETLHGMVRRRVVGASEVLTKEKIKKVIEVLTASNRLWFKHPQSDELFFDRLKELYPGCCDGKPLEPRNPEVKVSLPVPVARRGKPKLITQPPIKASKLAQSMMLLTAIILILCLLALLK